MAELVFQADNNQIVTALTADFVSIWTGRNLVENQVFELKSLRKGKDLESCKCLGTTDAGFKFQYFQRGSHFYFRSLKWHAVSKKGQKTQLTEDRFRHGVTSKRFVFWEDDDCVTIKTRFSDRKLKLKEFSQTIGLPHPYDLSSCLSKRIFIKCGPNLLTVARNSFIYKLKAGHEKSIGRTAAGSEVLNAKLHINFNFYQNTVILRKKR